MSFSVKVLKLLSLLLIQDHLIIGENIKQLPHCASSEKDVGFVLVSTLDGKLTSITANGNFLWDVDTGPGPLLISNIHNVELTNNGEWVRIIPSLAGSLYKFNGKTIDAIPITAESLLRSSFLYSNDLVIAGGRDVRTYGIEATSGEMIYECSSEGCFNKTKSTNSFDDIVLIERTTTTVRAHEPRTGTERWNFSVGYHNVKIPQANCINLDSTITNLNLTAILPEGILNGYKMSTNELLWQYAFNSPIVKVWKWNGRDLFPVDLFQQAKPRLTESVLNLSPSIYLGMHDKQLYVHESDQMINSIQQNYKYPNTEVVESKSLTRFPWKPISAAELKYFKDDSTAISVLYSTEYVNGKGYYFYSEIDVERSNTILCKSNSTKTFFSAFIISRSFYWKEILLLVITAIILNIFWNYGGLKYIKGQSNSNNSDKEKSKESSITASTSIFLSSNSERTHSESSDSISFVSRYVKDFDTVRCLGRGGYGVVFEVKQKIDECGYAIKRITLPHKIKSQQKVLREVKALAKLDHKNIVRYCTSWVECPPPGWNLAFDSHWLDDATNPTALSEDFSKSSVFNKGISTIINIQDNSDSTRNTPTKNVSLSDGSHSICFRDDSKESTSKSLEGVKEDSFDNSASDSIEEMSETSSNIALDESSNSNKFKSKSETSCNKESLVSNKKNDVSITFLYIQMQLCQKDSLKDWLTTQQKREKEIIMPIYNQILCAVEYVHSQKLIHRDLKPSNVFFSQDGFVKVGDFGLVTSMRNLDDDFCYDDKLVFNRSYTKGAGTFLYMSPEQIDGKSYDHKVDIYSLGVILFELLVPFSTEMERQRTLSRLRDGLYPNNFCVNYPKEFDILSKMLSITPSERPEVTTVRNVINGFSFEE